MPSKPPSRRLERELLASGHRLVAGMDEVGRGALAGPVTVGVVVVDDTTGRTPAGLRDSKLLRPHVRERLCGPIRRWARASAVGHAGPDEIDRYGIIAALRMAGNRALARLAEEGVVPDVVVLDGKHDWLTHPPHMPPLPVSGPQLPVVMRIKGDLTVTSIAAASVLAKCERDAMMTELHETYPAYGWHGNKGYSAPEHAAALREHGPCELHRRSWSLPQSEVYETEELPLELVGEPRRGAEGA
ncbi:MAG TPA: ribonuclease HII [Actinotalea caeni]|uniref:ribonuclease HII n=1 Tax=Actinotalea caeni TaxID=1348467 RepID=UPI0012E1223C|nr:ribonuclease HII [Actinotalea caeni]HLV57013.1 ribonuclease HII [Actinotalea caeni]